MTKHPYLPNCWHQLLAAGKDKLMDEESNRLLNGLCRLTFTERDIETACRAYATLRMPDAEILSIAKLHKVQTVLYNVLSKIASRLSQPASPLLIQMLSQENDKSTQHVQLLKDEVISVILDQSSPISHSRSTLLKGMSVARFYPPDCPRWMRDVDVHVDNVQSAFALCRWFCQHGFEIDSEELPWFKLDIPTTFTNQGLYGQFVIRKTFESDYARVDIHYNRYSISYAGYLDYDLLEALQMSEIDGVPAPVLSPEACLILMFAHMPSMGYVGIKDINDFAAITSLAEPNWDAVASALVKSQLVPQAIQTVEQVLALYDHPRIVEGAEELKRALPTSERKTFWKLHDRDWQLRARINARYTFDFERRFAGGSLLRAANLALQCYLYYLPRFKVRFAKRSIRDRLFLLSQPRFNLLNSELDRRICIRLVPIATFRPQPINLKDPGFIKQVKSWYPGSKHYEYGETFLYVEIGTAQLIITELFLSVCTVDLVVEPQAQTLGELLARQINEILGNG